MRTDYFWSLVARGADNECWPWLGYIDDDGYARYSRQGAYRLTYELVVGPVPDGMELDHLCRVRHCVNPHHLEPVTKTENVRRGVSPQAINYRKTHCVNGHPLTGENLYTQGGTRRQCRRCNAAAQRRHRDRLRRLAA